jgi:hypothetical protein
MAPTITSIWCRKAATKTASNFRWRGYARTISIEAIDGAMVLARLVDDEKLSNEILKETRASLPLS